jgi:hypothetical protein
MPRGILRCAVPPGSVTLSVGILHAILSRYGVKMHEALRVPSKAR